MANISIRGVCIFVRVRCVSHPPWAIFQLDDISKVGIIVSVPQRKVGVGNISPRDSEHVSPPLGCRAIELGKPSQGGVISSV